MARSGVGNEGSVVMDKEAFQEHLDRQEEVLIGNYKRMEAKEIQYYWKVDRLTRRAIRAELTGKVIVEGARAWMNGAINKSIEFVMGSLKEMAEGTYEEFMSTSETPKESECEVEKTDSEDSDGEGDYMVKCGGCGQWDIPSGREKVLKEKQWKGRSFSCRNCKVEQAEKKIEELEAAVEQHTVENTILRAEVERKRELAIEENDRSGTQNGEMSVRGGEEGTVEGADGQGIEQRAERIIGQEDREDPLGIFYPFRQRVEGRWFKSDAHCISYTKARFEGENSVAVQVLMEEDPVKAYKLGESINVGHGWREVLDSLMELLLQQKLEGCNEFWEELRESAGKIRALGEDEDWTEGRSGGGSNMTGEWLMRNRGQMEESEAAGEWVVLDEWNAWVKEGDREEDTAKADWTHNRQGENLLVVVGDSIIKSKDIKRGLEECLGESWEVWVLKMSGKTLEGIRRGGEERIREISEGGGRGCEEGQRKMRYIMIHGGTNDMSRLYEHRGGGPKYPNSIERSRHVASMSGEAIKTMEWVERLYEDWDVKIWSEMLVRPRSDNVTNEDLSRCNQMINKHASERGWAVVTHEEMRRQPKDVMFKDGLHLDEDQGVKVFVQDTLDTIWAQGN